MTNREISLFERRTRVCYCVSNGASECGPCRERRVAREPEIADGPPCPNCGNTKHWYPEGKVDPMDMLIAQLGGPLAPVIMSISGGHCLACNYQEEAVYA